MSNLNLEYLSTHERTIIETYIQQYNQTNAHIVLLHDMLDNINGNIRDIIRNSRHRNNRFRYNNTNNNNNNTNSYRDFLFGDTNNLYNYQIPINRQNQQTNMRNNQNQIGLNGIGNLNANRARMNPHVTGYSQNNNLNFSNNLNSILNNFLNTSVIITPTEQQIQSSTRTIRFGDIVSPNSDACPISLEQFNNDDIVSQIIPCGHIFNQSQLRTWFNSNVRCPVCRYDIRNYIDNQHTETTEEPTSQENSSNVSSEEEQSSNDTFNNQDRNSVNNLIDSFTRNIFQSLLNNPQNTGQQNTGQQNNERFLYDASNNVIIFETVLRPLNNN